MGEAEGRLGASVHAHGTKFVAASGIAERISLCLFDPEGAETDRLELTPDGEGIWSVDAAGVQAGQHYGYRVHGPGDLANGHACDPAKLLIDPAAHRVTGNLKWSLELVTPGVDSAPLVPRSVVAPAVAAVDPSSRPRTPWDQTVIYEAHVAHLTARHGLVPEEQRGRYGGLAAGAVVDHLQRLGVTAIELLPVQQFVSESNLVTEGRRNVWGYNPIAWGAPHAAYASAGGDPLVELRAAVSALHDAGIEVWLDVVFNHTCEGSLGSGPILSWRGFDNAATYRLRHDPAKPHQMVDDDVTGCGNAVDTTSPVMRRLIVELLARWVDDFGIDGFRFDLAATLIREANGPTADHPLLADIAAHRSLADVKLVAEPWDVGMGGYVLGAFPEPWREWNDRFRDSVRDLVRAHATLPEAASAITASAGVFVPRPPSSSVNAVATHDGFGVRDLVTYDNSVEGGHGQRSWNGGVEGPTTDADLLAARGRRQRMLIGLTVLAQGTPMINSGDEIGRTQGGRADGYTLEPSGWGLPWPEADWDLAEWTSEAVALRRACRVLTRDDWVAPADPRIHWYDGWGRPMDDDAWHRTTAIQPDRSLFQLGAAVCDPSGSEPRVDSTASSADTASPEDPEDMNPQWPRALQVVFAPDHAAGETGPAVLLVVVAGLGERKVILPEGIWRERLNAEHPRGSADENRSDDSETHQLSGSISVTGPTLVAFTQHAY